MNALALLVASLPVPQDAAAPKVEEQVLAPVAQGVRYFVSPRGAHLAAVAQKGSRFVVLVDGVEGPKFDEVHDPVVFSPDGSRYAYWARSGQEAAVVVDGKDLVRIQLPSDGYSTPAVADLAFTSNGKHVWFTEHVHKSNNSGDDFDRIVFDGEPQISGGRSPVFSPDGEHCAYLATNPKDSSKQALILDGKLAGYTGTDPVFTGDSKHLIAKTQVALGGNKGQAIELLLDGKPWIRAENVVLYPAPAGDLCVAVVYRSGASAGGGAVQFLVVGGKKVEGSDAASISAVHFSPDGKRYAAECDTPSHTRYIFVDGKRQQEYQIVQDFAFSEDSSRYGYKAYQGGKTFVVVDGEESDGFQNAMPIVFGGGGKRVGYLGTGDGLDRWIVVDQKPVKRSARSVSDLVFSPDGAHWGCLLSDGTRMRLVVDGTDDEACASSDFRSIQGIAPAKYAFSPDGKHFVQFGASASGKDSVVPGLFFDHGRAWSGQGVWDPTFTPDGRHLFWLTAEGGRYTIYADGKSCGQIDANTHLPGGSHVWEMGSDGVLTVLCTDGDKVKRLRITPSSQTSVETLAAAPK